MVGGAWLSFRSGLVVVGKDRTIGCLVRNSNPSRPSLQVSARMRSVRVRHTAPELAVRQLLHSLGIRFRVRPTSLPGRPDITNVRQRWCIFVHGCFWHAHVCWRGRLPKKNVRFWREKMLSNRARDERAESELRARGFRVLTVWQCELDNRVILKRKLSTFIKTLVAEASAR